MSDQKREAAEPAKAPAPTWGRLLSRVLAWGLGLLGAGLAAAATVMAIALAVAYPKLPDIRGLTDYRPKLPMRVFSADGVLIGEFGEERRSFTPISEIPRVMQEAVLSIEDNNFFNHSGVDFKGMLRASLAQFADAKSQGASTITMQVARNFYLPTEKTYTRKIYEVLLAFKIESQLTKPQILEIYMNQIYLGQRAYGFTSAAETYFGKSIKQVTVAEAAMLAGLPKAPSAYNPIVNPDRATQRQRYIIDRMLENGYITAAQRDEARAQVLSYRAKTVLPVHAEFVAEAARMLMFSRYGEEAYTRGLNVYTAVQSEEQMQAYRALRTGLLDFDRRNGYRGPEAYLDLPKGVKSNDPSIVEALQDHPDNDEFKSAVVLEASPAKVRLVRANGAEFDVTGRGLALAAPMLQSKANPKKKIGRGAVVRIVSTDKAEKEWTITQVPEIEGAFVSIDPKTGWVRSLVGGFDFSKNKFNHVTQAWRQPGSVFKPFMYSAALEKGFTPATVVNDAPLFFDATVTGSQPWEPKNYDGVFDGPMSLRRGLAKSKNMISIRVLQSITPEYAQAWITRFGFSAERNPAFLTLALGAGAVTPMQLASGYSVFANGGYLVNPVLITQVTDAKGKVLAAVDARGPDETQRVIDERNAFVMSRLLQEVTKTGTAKKAQVALRRPDLFGKTGTTNDSQDAWFAGYQPGLVAVVWIGYDTPRKMGDKETGGGLALPVWIDYMAKALKAVPIVEGRAPQGVVNQGGEWYFEEYAGGRGVASLGLEDKLPGAASAPTEEERKGILDLFNQD